MLTLRSSRGRRCPLQAGLARTGSGSAPPCRQLSRRSFCRRGATTMPLRCATCSVTAWAGVGCWLQLSLTAPSAGVPHRTNGLAHSATCDTSVRSCLPHASGFLACTACLSRPCLHCDVLILTHASTAIELRMCPQHRHGATAPLHRADVRTLMEVLASVRSIVGPAHPASLPIGCPGWSKLHAPVGEQPRANAAPCILRSADSSALRAGRSVVESGFPRQQP